MVYTSEDQCCTLFMDWPKLTSFLETCPPTLLCLGHVILGSCTITLIGIIMSLSRPSWNAHQKFYMKNLYVLPCPSLDLHHAFELNPHCSVLVTPILDVHQSKSPPAAIASWYSGRSIMGNCCRTRQHQHHRISSPIISSIIRIGRITSISRRLADQPPDDDLGRHRRQQQQQQQQQQTHQRHQQQQHQQQADAILSPLRR